MGGSNDFIGAEGNYNPLKRNNFWLAHCTFGFRRKAEEVVTNLWEFLETLHCMGCRWFLVADLPFTSSIPALGVARVAHVNKRGCWLSEQIENMLVEFRARHAGGDDAVNAARIPERIALNRIVEERLATPGGRARDLFLKDWFHPTNDMHEMLAESIAARLPRSSSFLTASFCGKGDSLL